MSVQRKLNEFESLLAEKSFDAIKIYNDEFEKTGFNGFFFKILKEEEKNKRNKNANGFSKKIQIYTKN